MNIFPFNFLFLNSRPPKSPLPPKGRIRLAFDALSGAVKAINSVGEEVPFSGSSGPIEGVTDGSNAAAGIVGEYKSNVGIETALTSGVVRSSASIILTAGDWDVFGGVQFYAANADITQFAASLSEEDDAPAPGPGESSVVASALEGFSGIYAFPVPSKRFSVTENTEIYLIVQSIFSGDAVTGNGQIYARRVR